MLNPEDVQLTIGRQIEIYFSVDGEDAVKIRLDKDDAKRLAEMINKTLRKIKS